MSEIAAASFASVRRGMVRTALALGARLVRINVSVDRVLQHDPEALRAPMAAIVVGTDGGARLGRRFRDRASVGRADSIVYALLDPLEERVELLSIPRDVGVELPGIGFQRLGWALDYGGASLLTSSVQALIGLPIHHYVEVDFRGFEALVDALGGVEIHLDQPLRDRRTGLDLPRGRLRINGSTALALVRSRYRETIRDGRVRTESLGDRRRRDRLRTVIEALPTRLSHGIGVAGALRLIATASGHVVIDEGLAHADHAMLLAAARNFDLRFHDLPTRPTTSEKELASVFPPHQRTGSEYLELDRPSADVVIGELAASLARSRGQTTR